MRRAHAITALLALLAATGTAAEESAVINPEADANAKLAEQVRKTEIAFAQTMADRDHEAFVSFLAEETIFFNGEVPLRGKAAVAAAWKPLYEAEAAPFSWAPETVAVLDSGTLAISSGPVVAADGKPVATYQSIWRREADGNWKIVFDKGSPACKHE